MAAEELQNGGMAMRESGSHGLIEDPIPEEEGADAPWYRQCLVTLEEDLGRVTKQTLRDQGIPPPLTELAVSGRQNTQTDALEFLDTGAIRPRRGNSTVPLWMYRRQAGSEEFAWQRTSCFLDDQTLRCYDHTDATDKPCVVLDLYHVKVDDSAVRQTKDQLDEIFKVRLPLSLSLPPPHPSIP